MTKIEREKIRDINCIALIEKTDVLNVIYQDAQEYITLYYKRVQELWNSGKIQPNENLGFTDNQATVFRILNKQYKNILREVI